MIAVYDWRKRHDDAFGIVYYRINWTVLYYSQILLQLRVIL